jgi:hypothetical protein
MERSYLIQRLKPPFKGGASMNGVFSFGMVPGGGFNKEALNILSSVCEFDYMGASEFEWGAVPKAISTIYERKGQDICFRFSLPTTGKKMALIAMDIIVICPPDWKEEVQKRITGWAQDGQDDRLKEPTTLQYILKGGLWPNPVVGWLELNNGFMFFTDPIMAERFYKLLVTKEAVR